MASSCSPISSGSQLLPLNGRPHLILSYAYFVKTFRCQLCILSWRHTYVSLREETTSGIQCAERHANNSRTDHWWLDVCFSSRDQGLTHDQFAIVPAETCNRLTAFPFYLKTFSISRRHRWLWHKRLKRKKLQIYPQMIYILCGITFGTFPSGRAV